jgi:tetratricopeptide (TPR) repeat protein
MKFLAALISVISLAGFSWTTCPVPGPPSPGAGQQSALEDLRHTAFRYFQEGHYRNAAACYEEALHTAQALANFNITIVTDLQNLALIAEEMGNYMDARNYYLRELDLLNHLGAASSVAAGEAYLELGGLLQIQGLFSEAETHYKKAVGLLTQHAGSDDLRTAKALGRLGRLYMERAKFAEASTLLRKARATAEKSLTEDNPKLITFFDAEAYFLCQTGKYREAEKKWMSALKIAERAYGENEIQYGTLLLHLGQMYSVLGDYPVAETMLQRSLAANEKTSGSDPVDRAIIMSSLAAAYTKHRKLAEAEPLVKSVEASNASCSEAPISCAFIRSNLGGYYMTTGQWGAAKLEFGRALKLREDTLGEHPLVADSLICLSRALRMLNRKKEAKIYETRAGQILESQRNPAYDASNTIDVRSFQANNR